MDPPTEPVPSSRDGGSLATATAGSAVTALYQAHALGLIRLAVVMLGDRPAVEDLVQEAFRGLYRRWAGQRDRGPVGRLVK